MADTNSPIWSGAQLSSFIVNRWCIETFLEMSVELSIGSWHAEFADTGVVTYEHVDFGFDVGDGSNFTGYCFVSRVGIRSTVQTLNDIPHIWTVWIRHCALKEIFPTFCLGLFHSLGGFTASIDLPLSVLMDCPTEAISCNDFGLHVWNHPRTESSARFCFPDVGCCSWDENIIETRYTERKVSFVREIVHFRLDFIWKAGSVNAVTSPSSSSWDSRLVADLIINFDENRKMDVATNWLC